MPDDFRIGSLRMRLGVIIFTGIAFVAGGITAPATNAVSPPHVLFGAWVQQGSAPTHADAVRALEGRLGFTLGIDNHYRPWTNTFWRDEQDDIASGRTPMVSWTARGTTAVAIASGSQDATIARVAEAVKALKSRVLVRFAYEMDQPKSGPRYAWAAPRGKALIVAETGVQEDPADPARKAAWFADAAAWIHSHTAIRAVSYFDGVSPKGYDFRLDSSDASVAAWRAMAVETYG